MKRVLPPFVLLLGLGLLAGFAYFTRHPESPLLERAREWPLVGGLAARFRRAYLGEGQGEEGPVEETSRARSGKRGRGGVEVVVRRVGADGKPLTRRQLAGDEPIALPDGIEPPRASTRSKKDRSDGKEGRGPAPLPVDNEPTPSRESGGAAVAPVVALPSEPPIPFLASEWRWFLPGNTIRAEPRTEGEVQARLRSLAWLPVLDREGVWAEVVHGGERGWIDTSWQPDHPRKGARRGLLRHRTEPVRSSDWGDLVRARKILGVKRATVKVGAYDLLTDVEAPELIHFLDRAAAAAEDAYFARYGRLPSGNPGRTAVLFAKRQGYREFSGSNSLLASHFGQARTGILAFFAEGQSREELAGTLVHEITHLLNDRALAWNLPTWLEEGLATDLGSVWVEDSRIVRDLDQVRGRGLAIQSTDMRYLLLGEILDQGGLPSSATLMNLDYKSFHTDGKIEDWAYAHSFALVRYLLDGDAGRHRAAFLKFLKKIAGGWGADPRVLLEILDLDMRQLDRGLQAWLVGRVAAARARLDRRAARNARR